MRTSRQEITVGISGRTIVMLIGIAALVWILIQIADFLILLFASVVVAAAVAPFVRSMEHRGLPRWLAVIIIYIGFFAFIALTLFLLVPTVSNQVADLADGWPKISQALQELVGRNAVLQDAYRSLSNAAGQSTSAIFGNVVNITAGFINSIIMFVVFLVLTFYLLFHGRRVVHFIVNLIPEKNRRERYGMLLAKISDRMGYWFRGQLLISFTTFIMLWLAFTLLGVPYALTLAMIGGLAEFIPLFGSWIGVTPAVLVALGQSPMLALFVGLIYFLWQNFQGYIISPQIMRQMLGVPSIMVLILVLILAKLIGFVGVFLAAPIAAALGVLVQEYSGSVERRLRKGLARAGQAKI